MFQNREMNDQTEKNVCVVYSICGVATNIVDGKWQKVSLFFGRMNPYQIEK